MEVGPTHNRRVLEFSRAAALRRRPDRDLAAVCAIAQRLADYSYAAAKDAHKTGMPIVRPLFLIEPQSAAAWSNWWTYRYGPDILVSPIWEKEQRTQEVYLPAGSQWRDAWQPEKIYPGGRTITVNAELHQLPIFVRVGAKIELGDLNKEWTESVASANTRPDLKRLDAEVKAWFDKRYSSR